ncbi:hypothetical protein PSTG_19483, partial [Puccinia striiformis f. sp. tritici PST-78]
MQKGLDQQKGGSQRRDRMIQELPTAKAVDKQVADMAQELASLKQQLRSLLPNRYNQTTSSNQQEYTRSNDRPSTPLYESAICYYCLRESHTTYRCPELAKDESQGLVTRRGRDYFLPNGNQIPWNPTRPIRSVVAAASADPKILEAADKIAAARK